MRVRSQSISRLNKRRWDALFLCITVLTRRDGVERPSTETHETTRVTRGIDKRHGRRELVNRIHLRLRIRNWSQFQCLRIDCLEISALCWAGETQIRNPTPWEKLVHSSDSKRSFPHFVSLSKHVSVCWLIEKRKIATWLILPVAYACLKD